MKDEKLLMRDVATLYYERRLTQQEIAQIMHLSRQTISKLLGDAVAENVVEIIIHDPQAECAELEQRICKTYGISKCIACCVSGKNESLHRLMAVKAAVEHILPAIQMGGKKIAVSWGRTIQELIHTIPETETMGNTVFPLFGATDSETACFASNELARNLADKLGATLKCAWFPYLTDSDTEYRQLRQMAHCKQMQEMWDSADLALLGIGDTKILEVFGRTFGYSAIHSKVIGDVATHFFDDAGKFLNLYENTLCASVENLKNAKETVAVACGTEKAQAIAAALRTGVIDTLITDEQTARLVLEHSAF